VSALEWLLRVTRPDVPGFRISIVAMKQTPISSPHRIQTGAHGCVHPRVFVRGLVGAEVSMTKQDSQSTEKPVGDPSPHLSAQRFFAQLHEVVRERLPWILDDLRDRGWHPVVPQLGGERATGYRDLAAQEKAKNDERSNVAFGFHNVTDAAGNPKALAVHITDKSLGEHYPLTHPFLKDLATVAERYGAKTGLSWKKPDPLHVQFGNNKILRSPKTLGALKAGTIPPPPQPLISAPYFPRALARGQFDLHSMFGFGGHTAPAFRPFMAPPKVGQPAIPPPMRPIDMKMQLRPPDLKVVAPPPAWQDVTRHAFRPIDTPFERPHGFNDLHLLRPTIQPGWAGGSSPMRLTEPMLSLGIHGPTGSLGNFQLRPPHF